MRVGVDYYPEYWGRARWAKDADLMQAAGINVVRIAEFAWSRLEPEDGTYDFGWLDEVIATLGERGIATVLCTPSAAPPPWMTTAHRDILPRDRQGNIKDAGGRRHTCVNSITYKDYCARIVRKMAAHFAANASVVAWQIDNEFGCHDTTRCYCDACCEAFRDWLKGRYAGLDEINRRWGLAFWSGEFTDWDQVPLPWYNVAGHSPSLELDFARFSSWANVQFAKAQVDIIRELAPHQPITTNLMGCFDEIDYYDLAEAHDFVSWDNYPLVPYEPHKPALDAAVMRGVARGKPVWVMEQQVSQTNWSGIDTRPRPGQCRLWTYQQLAHGADAIVYFRWRACPGGLEKMHGGVLHHDGLPDSRFYEEVSQVGDELARIGGEIEGTRVAARVAMLYSYEDIWAADYKPRPTRRLTWLDHFERYFRAFYRANIAVDVVHPGDDLSAYGLVVAPMLHIVTPTIRENLERYVSGGGTFVATLFSGFCDDCAVITEKSLPGELRELLGVRVKDFDPLGESMQNAVRPEPGTLPGAEYAVDLWADVVEPEGAAVIARFCHDMHVDRPAVTANAFGDGKAIYVGTVGDEPFFTDLVAWLGRVAALDVSLDTPPGVEYRVRTSDSAATIFLLNHNAEPVEVKLGRELTDMFTGRAVSGTIAIGARDLCVLKEGLAAR